MRCGPHTPACMARPRSPVPMRFPVQLCDKRDKVRGGAGARDVKVVKINQQIRMATKTLKTGRNGLREMLNKEKSKKKVGCYT